MREDPRHLLDDAGALAQQDPADMLGLVENAADQWKEAAAATTSFAPPEEWRRFRRVVVAGMGGSAIAADVAATWLSRRWPVSIQVIRDYSLPLWVDEETLVVVCSYSGNTEETLSVWREAGRRGLERAVITSGGELGKEAGREGIPSISLAGGLPPRAAFPSAFVSLVRLLSGVGPEGDSAPGGEATLREMESVPETLSELRSAYGRDVVVLRNPAKELALWIGIGWPVVYAPEYPLAPVALRWRGQLGENAKRVASGHLLPEMNHNEIVGWEVQKEIYPLTRVVMMEDLDEGERTARRIGITARLLEGAGASVKRVSASGEKLLTRMMSLISLGDYTSVYLGTAWGVDPTPVEKIDHLKSKLAEAE